MGYSAKSRRTCGFTRDWTKSKSSSLYCAASSDTSKLSETAKMAIASKSGPRPLGRERMSLKTVDLGISIADAKRFACHSIRSVGVHKVGLFFERLVVPSSRH